MNIDWSKHRNWMLGVVGTALFLALALLASLPTGGDDPEDAVTDGSRLATSQRVDDVVVQVLSKSGGLAAQVAYQGPKGWLGVRLDSVSDDTVAAWASTTGEGPVPSLSLVFGRAPGSNVDVTWDDAVVTSVTTESDGVFVVARPGRHTSQSVAIRDDAGTVVLEVDGP